MKNIILILIFIFSFNIFGEEITLSSKDVKQGEFFTLTLPESEEFEISFPPGKTPIKTFQVGTSQLAIVPVHYSTIPGNYPLIVKGKGGFLWKEIVAVRDGEFEKSYITVGSATGRKKSKENVKTMINYAREARKDPAQEKLWEDEFIYPLKGRISSPFGATRYVNNRLSGSSF